MANGLDDRALRNAKWKGADRWLSDGGSRGAGRLVAKISAKANGQGATGTRITFYFSYFNAEGQRRFYAVGEYGQISLKAARVEAGELSKLYQRGTVNLHDHFAAINATKARADKEAQEVARRAEERARSHTLRQLLEAYVSHLERAGKQSAGDVKSIFNLHVLDARPDLAGRHAGEIPMSEFVDLLAKLADAGKGRTAGKLRSYLRAAYSLAIRSKFEPDAPLAFKAFGIEANPLASIAALKKYNRARDRNLSAEEMHHFLKRLDAMPADQKTDALNLTLLMGGQRMAQLLRTKPVDVDLGAERITLYDPKGKRDQPRPHLLPITKQAAAIVARALKTHGECPAIFTTDGKRPLRTETVSALVTQISAAMVKAKEAREKFQMRDLRRTCETMLASLKVSSDIRAQLQSHGLGGIQQRHYDRHDYALEKRAALLKWQKHLEALRRPITGKVLRFAKEA